METIAFTHLTESFSCQQHVNLITHETHQSGHTLDIILTRPEHAPCHINAEDIVAAQSDQFAEKWFCVDLSAEGDKTYHGGPSATNVANNTAHSI